VTTTLILLRHGQSQANADGIFTGLLDVPLTAAGRAEAERSACLLNEAGLAPSMWFCSPMLRARQTAAILQDRMPGAPATIDYDWRLTERNYGALTGQSKEAVLTQHGPHQYLTWRRSIDVAPPAMTAAQRAELGSVNPQLGLTEALSDVILRVDALWSDRMAPALRVAGSLLVVAHGNSLRALCTVLDRLDDAAVQGLNIPTGQPLVYRLDDDLRPLAAGGRYLDQGAATAAVATIALEGGT
jgi:2,3-bisphosphoglycerate-dependent phosphoglycerate mutase